MIRQIVALIVILSAPAVAWAEAIQFRNDTPIAVVVQGAVVVRGVVRRDKPYLIASGLKSPVIVLPGEKIISLYDAKAPNRVLTQMVLPASPEDQLLSIQVDPKTGGLKLIKQPNKSADPARRQP